MQEDHKEKWVNTLGSRKGDSRLSHHTINRDNKINVHIQTPIHHWVRAQVPAFTSRPVVGGYRRRWLSTLSRSDPGSSLYSELDLALLCAAGVPPSCLWCLALPAVDLHHHHHRSVPTGNRHCCRKQKVCVRTNARVKQHWETHWLHEMKWIYINKTHPDVVEVNSVTTP